MVHMQCLYAAASGRRVASVYAVAWFVDAHARERRCKNSSACHGYAVSPYYLYGSQESLGKRLTGRAEVACTKLHEIWVQFHSHPVYKQRIILILYL